ncbi:galactokinase [Nocardioides bruguierae]|uniref:Galactokinase n=1 Tax=Nocardioides bruguierae TaxID=2945102 RepID=A0A9X2IET7_9ACTN|nr:galactokinase [Nocardioides bruguierae]MCM0618955.1 galactokinase [Nocardioides bruguierae]
MTFLEPGDPQTTAEHLGGAFREAFGAPAQVVGRAPGRVNLIGEHTDYNAGLVLPLALAHATFAAARRRTDDRVRVRSRQSDETWEGTLAEASAAPGWAGYAAGVLWALAEREGVPVPGMDVLVDSTVPLGAGLSSSAALECAVAVAAVALADQELDDDLRARLVRAAMTAETEVVGAPTGGMDQTIAMHGRGGAALLIDFRSGEHRPVPLDLDDLGLTVLVTDTRVSHALHDGGYASRRADCEEAARLLGLPSLREATLEQVEGLADDRLRRRARHIVTEIARVTATVEALAEQDRAALGRLFLASHVSMRDDFEISCEELDTVVETAVEAGAVGARMTGGGFGGSAVSLVPTERVSAVVRAIDARFVTAGFRAPAHLLGVPSVGAGRLG